MDIIDMFLLIGGSMIGLVCIGAYVYCMYLKENNAVEDGYIAGENAFGKGFFIRVFIMCTCIFVGVVILFAFSLSNHEPLQENTETTNRDEYNIYINGEPVSKDFDINGIDLEEYQIQIKNDTIYLMNKDLER